MYIDRIEVLRYLGYKGQNIDETLENLLAESIVEVKQIAWKRFVYNIFNLKRKEDKIVVEDTNLIFQSKDLARHLSGSDKCVLLAATLGLEVDRRIAYYSKMNLTKGIIMDACASVAIEALCDELSQEIGTRARAEGYYITSRYSPGYGDLPLTLQKDLVRVLKAYSKIGLTVNESSIMLPRKSITAIIGWQREENRVEGDKCWNCKEKTCLYRKRGDKGD
jgi:hypothetical protein